MDIYPDAHHYISCTIQNGGKKTKPLKSGATEEIRRETWGEGSVTLNIT